MSRKLTLALLTTSLLLPGCSSVKVWPFDDSNTASTQKRGPANATEYQCSMGKRFYVRQVENGNSVWLIYSDREVALNKSTSGSDTRYSNGVAVLVIAGNEATLTDGPTINYSGCKAAGK